MNTARFEGSPTELHSEEVPPEQSQVTLVRGRPPLSTRSASLGASEQADADVENSPIARLILSQERSRLTRPSALDASMPRIDRAKGLPVTVLTDDPKFAHQIRAALDNTSDVTAVGTADEAAELAVSGRCPILVTDTAITQGAIEQLTARLRSHDPAMVFIVAGRRDQGGAFISLQSSGTVDGFLLKPPTAGATQLVVESATKRHRALGDGGDSISAPTRARSRTRTPRTHPSTDDAAALSTPTIEAHAPARTAQTITPLATTDNRTPRRTMPRPSWPIVIAALAAVGGIVWWIMWLRLPDIDPQRVIAQQLALADSAQQAGRWIGTPNSATYYYQTVLALDPNNFAAQRGLDRVAAELSRRTQTAMSRQHLAEAAASLERLRELEPEYAELPLLDSQLRVLRDSVLAAHSPAPVVEPAQTPRVESPPVRQRTATRTVDRVPRTDRIELSATDRKPAAATQAIIETKPAPLTQTASAPPAPVALPSSSSNATATQQEAPVQSTATPPAATIASNTAPNVPAMASIPTTIRPQTSPQTSLQSSAPAPTAAAPKILKYVPPVYPNEAYARGIEGWVQVSLQVAPNGSVAEVRIEDGEKRQLFSRAALAAVKQWQYEPNPQATTETPVTVRLDFRMSR